MPQDTSMAENSDQESFGFMGQADGMDSNSPSVWQWIVRFKHILLISALLLLQSCMVSSQLPFIKTTWFARQHDPTNSELNCNDDPKLTACQEGAADLAYWTGILTGVSGFVAIVSAVVLGALSDAVGRKRVIQISMVLSICVKFMLVAVVFFDIDLWYFLGMETLDACFDANGVWFAMVADLTKGQSHQRGPVFGSLIFLLILLACVFMPLSALLSYKVAVACAAALSVVCLCFVVCALPETCAETSSSDGVRNLPGELHNAFRILNRNSFMKRMIAILTLGGVAFASKSTIMRPYMMAHFGMNKKTFAMLLPICAPSIGICFTIGLWKSVARFGDVRVLQASFFANTVMTLGVVVAGDVWQIFVVYGLLIGPGLMFIPLINAIKSNLCSDEEQGKIQGLVAAIRGFAVSFADIAFGALYKWTTNGGKSTEGARSSLYLVLGLNLASAALTLTLPTTYPKFAPIESAIVQGSPQNEVEMKIERDA